MKLRELITDYDNQTLDTARTLAVFLLCSYTLLQAWSLYESGQFDPQAFGVGAASILGALGVAVAGDNHKRPPE